MFNSVTDNSERRAPQQLCNSSRRSTTGSAPTPSLTSSVGYLPRRMSSGCCASTTPNAWAMLRGWSGCSGTKLSEGFAELASMPWRGWSRSRTVSGCSSNDRHLLYVSVPPPEAWVSNQSNLPILIDRPARTERWRVVRPTVARFNRGASDSLPLRCRSVPHLARTFELDHAPRWDRRFESQRYARGPASSFWQWGLELRRVRSVRERRTAQAEPQADHLGKRRHREPVSLAVPPRQGSAWPPRLTADTPRG